MRPTSSNLPSFFPCSSPLLPTSSTLPRHAVHSFVQIGRQERARDDGDGDGGEKPAKPHQGLRRRERRQQKQRSSSSGARSDNAKPKRDFYYILRYVLHSTLWSYVVHVVRRFVAAVVQRYEQAVQGDVCGWAGRDGNDIHREREKERERQTHQATKASKESRGGRHHFLSLSFVRSFPASLLCFSSLSPAGRPSSASVSPFFGFPFKALAALAHMYVRIVVYQMVGLRKRRESGEKSANGNRCQYWVDALGNASTSEEFLFLLLHFYLLFVSFKQSDRATERATRAANLFLSGRKSPIISCACIAARCNGAAAWQVRLKRFLFFLSPWGRSSMPACLPFRPTDRPGLACQGRELEWGGRAQGPIKVARPTNQPTKQASQAI